MTVIDVVKTKPPDSLTISIFKKPNLSLKSISHGLTPLSPPVIIHRERFNEKNIKIMNYPETTQLGIKVKNNSSHLLSFSDLCGEPF
jgi:hypothetical protein